MADRSFSNSVQLEVIKANLEKNSGSICCESCGRKLLSINECHFDHIFPYAKGGKSTYDNCQILCVECNLKKSDKQLEEFALEEKARRFLLGETIETEDKHELQEPEPVVKGNMTKELFDSAIRKFIAKNGDIHQIDFSRVKNNLPGISYMIKYYGTLNNLKIAFGIADISSNWNRESIKKAFEAYMAKHSKITQKDIRKENGLPSINCVLNYYPEFKDFSDIKRGLCNINVPKKWTYESAIEAGKNYVISNNGRLTQKDCSPDNGLPALSTVYRLFGDLVSYQKLIGAQISMNVYVSKEQIETAVIDYFGDEERVIESRAMFLETFPYGTDAISGRYGSFNAFLKEFGIRVIKTKKFRYSKTEVDDAITAYVKSGKPIPSPRDLGKLGLPTSAVIMKYYDHWQEPFELFQAMYKKVGG